MGGNSIPGNLYEGKTQRLLQRTPMHSIFLTKIIVSFPIYNLTGEAAVCLLTYDI